MGIIDDHYGGYGNLAFYTGEDGDVDFDGAYGTTYDETINARVGQLARKHLESTESLDESDDCSEYEGASDLDDDSYRYSGSVCPSVDSMDESDLVDRFAARREVTNRKCTQFDFGAG